MDTQSQNQMKMPRFQMVVALDGSDRAEAVLEYALDQACRHERAELHLLTVAPSLRDEPAAAARLTKLARTKLEVFPHMVPPERRIRLHVRTGDPAEAITDLVLEIEPQLLVIGGSISGDRKPHLGPVADKLMTHVPCPVFAVRPPDYGDHPLRDKQCPACVAVRASSDGEQWFCEAHRDGGGSITGTLLLANNSTSLGGGLML